MSEELRLWRDKNLNKVSKSFCAAKWLNASLHLGHGFTNSCHLPLPHPVDLEEIKKNPSALHNTQHKKEMRKMMLKGERPAECSYCWKVEDIGRNNIADRIFKSQNTINFSIVHQYNRLNEPYNKIYQHFNSTYYPL